MTYSTMKQDWHEQLIDIRNIKDNFIKEESNNIVIGSPIIIQLLHLI